MLLWTLPAQSQQPTESQSCSGKMTEQLRRFNEQCLTDLVSYVASQPKASARVLGEKLKFYVQLTRTGAGLDAEAVSRANFPFMEAKTADAPPARTAEELAKALSAYGLTSGEAMSLTIGTQD